MLDKVIAILAALFIALISAFNCEHSCNNDSVVSGGAHHGSMLTPQDLINARVIKIQLRNGSWQNMSLPPDSQCAMQLEFKTNMLIDDKPKIWIPYNNIFRAGPDAIAGQTTWLMTPFLRSWQIHNMGDWLLKHGAQNPRIFDIGIGTGRSRDLWQMLHATQVSGVEPNASNVAELQAKRLPYLGKILTTGGADVQAITSNFQQHSFDIVMMSYSITFFVGSDLKKLHTVVDYLLKPGGIFIGLGMDGKIVKSWKSGPELDNPVFKIKYLKGDDIEITMKNTFTLVKAQREHLIDFDVFLKQWQSWTVHKREHIQPAPFLQDWAAKFVSAQQLFILQKPN